MTKLAAYQPRLSEQWPPRQRFAAPDELSCYYDSPAEPANVHLEFGLAGRLDAESFRAAVLAVLAATPRARARRAAAAAWHSRMSWEYPPVHDIDPVLVRSCADAVELAGLRSAFLSEPVPLQTSPPLRFLLARLPDGDRVILNAHHALLDGLSCLALIRAVAGQYQGARPWPDSPAAAAAAAAAAAVAARAVPGAEAGRSGHAAGPGPDGASPAAAPAPSRGRRPGATARIARDPDGPGRSQRPGYGAAMLTWAAMPAAAARLRPLGGTVNDLLITVLMLTISGWNAARDRGAGQIRITMPISDQAAPVPGGPDRNWGNLSRLAVIAARVPANVSVDQLLPVVAAQTRRAKTSDGPQVDLASRALAAAPLPVPAKRRLLAAGMRLAGPLLCDTSLVSNLGAIEPIWFGPLPTSQVWFSTSAHMPRGLSLGAITSDGRLHLTFRYRRELFSDAAAAEFGSRFGRLLDDFASPGGASMTGGAGLGVTVALTATTAYHLGLIVEKRALRELPEVDARRAVALLRTLLSAPLWLAGFAAMLCGFGLQTIALHLAPVSVVQPVLSSGVVILLVLSRVVLRERLGRIELGCVMIMAASIVAIAVSASGANGRPGYHANGAWIAAIAVPAALLGVAIGANSLRPASAKHRMPAIGVAYGVASGLLYGVATLAIKALSGTLSGHGGVLPMLGAVASSPFPYVTVACSAAGMLVFQTGLQRCRVAIVAPVSNIIGSLYFMVAGTWLFGERLPANSGLLALRLVGIVAAGAVVVVLSRQPAATAQPVPAAGGAGPAAVGAA